MIQRYQKKIIRQQTIVLLFVVSLLFLPFSTSANAVMAFKCQGKKVRTGDNSYSVIKNCGEPTYREVISAKDCKKVEIWYYDCKNNSRITELTFRAGILEERRRGDKTRGVQECN